MVLKARFMNARTGHELGVFTNIRISLAWIANTRVVSTSYTGMGLVVEIFRSLLRG